ncbi:Uncharacterised protein [Candidatus Norongarragalina meridionalis]|nr:Uncharacterised protein [Candidatus Norongarragalina meridionalis]
MARGTFMLFVAILFIAWGVLEIGKQMGWIPRIDFPWFALLLIAVGLALLVRYFRRDKVMSWC